MLSLSTSTRIFLCREAVDFRKAHDGLVAIIRDRLAEDIFEGGVFVFLNKRRDRIKLIEWDCNGLWLHYKRLEKGTFSTSPTTKPCCAPTDSSFGVATAVAVRSAYSP